MIYMEPLKTEAQWQWIHERARPILCADSCGILAVKDTGELLAAAVFDSFTVSACNVHMVIDSPIVLRHGFLEAIADDLFVKRQRSRVFGLTPSDNAKALRFNEHIGLRKIAEIEDAYDDGVGYVVTRMDKETCPWLSRVKEAA